MYNETYLKINHNAIQYKQRVTNNNNSIYITILITKYHLPYKATAIK